MPNLINRISEQWDLWVGPYRAFFPTSEDDRRECRHLTEAAGTVDGMPVSEGFGPASYQLAASQDTRQGQLVACLRLWDARQVATVRGKAAQYRLDLFGDDQLPRLAVCTHLSIHPEHERSQAAQLLLSHCFVEVLKAGGQAVILSGDPGHFSLYKRMGMRPIGPLGKTTEGLFRIPMVFIPDEEYLSLIHSPVLPLMTGVDFAAYEPIVRWYYQLVRENADLQTGAASYPESEDTFEEDHGLTEGLSPTGRETLLENAVVIRCREGEELIDEDDGGKSFGFVRRGIAKVLINEETSILLGEGDIFGEIAFILHSKRTARVVAAGPDTEVVVFNESAIDRLAEEADKAVIWRNLARVLARRVMLTNKLLG